MLSLVTPLKSFKWTSKQTKLNFNRLRSKYVIPGHFRRYTDTEITDDRARAWVNAKVHERAIKASYAKIRPTPEIITAYNNVGILKLSRIIDYPPWPLFQSITSKSRLTRYDLKQQKIAAINDIQSPYQQTEGKKDADKFEAKVIKYFRKQGVRLKSEEDLKAEQIKKYGRPIWTVDLWFADNPIMINGHLVHWIECKNYMYTDTKLFQRSVIKQVTKYREQWGSGAVVFSHGYSVPLNVPGVMILDGHTFVDGSIKKVITRQ